MNRLFRTEGPLLEAESHLYVERLEDNQIITDVRRGNYVALIGARQTGKTSLLLRLRRQLLEEGHIPIYLDPSPARDRDEEGWYSYLRGVILTQLRRHSPEIVMPPVRDQFDLREALRQVALQFLSPGQIVILMDEVSALPPDILEGFFSILGTIFNERETFPEFRRYVFVMAGAFVPEELVRQPPGLPFNVASRVYTSDASREGLAGLVRNLEKVGYAVSDEVIDRIYDWTGGHLYLTQRLCSILEMRPEARLTCDLVDRAVDDVLGDRNIRRVYEKLDGLPQGEQVIQRILSDEDPLRFSRASRLVARLELVGVIKSSPAGYCTIRNAIYRKALAADCLYPGGNGTEGLTKLEQKLFEYFSQNVRRTCSHSEVAEAMWGSGSFTERGVQDRIYQLVARLRQKMALDPAGSMQVITVRGRGYKPRRYE